MEKSKPPMVINQILREWWFPITVGLVIVLGTFFVLIPQANRLMELRTTLKSSQESLIQLQTKADQVNQLDGTYVENLAAMVAFALPSHKPYYEVFSLLQQLAGETGVMLGDFDLSPGSLATNSAKTQTMKDGYVSLDTTISIKGSTDQVVSFIDKLTRSLPLVTVTSITVSGDMTGTGIQQAQLEVTVHYTSENKQQSGNLEAKLPVMNDMDFQLLNTLMGYTAPREQTASSAAITDFNRQDIFTY